MDGFRRVLLGLEALLEALVRALGLVAGIRRDIVALQHHLKKSSREIFTVRIFTTLSDGHHDGRGIAIGVPACGELDVQLRGQIQTPPERRGLPSRHQSRIGRFPCAAVPASKPQRAARAFAGIRRVRWGKEKPSHLLAIDRHVPPHSDSHLEPAILERGKVPRDPSAAVKLHRGIRHRVLALGLRERTAQDDPPDFPERKHQRLLEADPLQKKLIGSQFQNPPVDPRVVGKLHDLIIGLRGLR